MPDFDGVLASIDACLDDDAVSEDAMRWAPDEPDPTTESVPEPTGGLTLWAECLNGERLYRTTTPPYEFVVRQGPQILLGNLPGGLPSPYPEAVAVYVHRFTAVQNAFHALAYQGDRRHNRRCSTCNPAGFPKPLAINGHEYNRRRRRRGRRWAARIAREIGEGSA